MLTFQIEKIQSGNMKIQNVFEKKAEQMLDSIIRFEKLAISHEIREPISNLPHDTKDFVIAFDDST